MSAVTVESGSCAAAKKSRFSRGVGRRGEGQIDVAGGDHNRLRGRQLQSGRSKRGEGSVLLRLYSVFFSVFRRFLLGTSLRGVETLCSVGRSKSGGSRRSGRGNGRVLGRGFLRLARERICRQPDVVCLRGRVVLVLVERALGGEPGNSASSENSVVVFLDRRLLQRLGVDDFAGLEVVDASERGALGHDARADAHPSFQRVCGADRNGLQALVEKHNGVLGTVLPLGVLVVGDALDPIVGLVGSGPDGVGPFVDELRPLDTIETSGNLRKRGRGAEEADGDHVRGARRGARIRTAVVAVLGDEELSVGMAEVLDQRRKRIDLAENFLLGLLILLSLVLLLLLLGVRGGRS